MFEPKTVNDGKRKEVPELSNDFSRNWEQVIIGLLKIKKRGYSLSSLKGKCTESVSFEGNRRK